MNTESLSQKEIDDLFSGGASPETSDAPEVTEAQLYDFRRPNRISKERMRALNAMYGVLTKSLESWLTSRIRGAVELDLQAVEQFSLGEFLLSLNTPCSSFIMEMADSGGQEGVVDFGQELAFLLVDRLLGGRARLSVQPRALTPLERLIVQLVADRVCTLLMEAWKDHIPLKLEITGFESLPDMVQIGNREDMMLVANIAVHVEGSSNTLLIALPFTVLESFFLGTGRRRFQLARSSQREQERDRMGIEEALRQAELQVRAVLPGRGIPMHILTELEPGSVLPTGISQETEVELVVAGQRRFRGVSGQVAGSLAVRINEVINNGRDQ